MYNNNKQKQKIEKEKEKKKSKKNHTINYNIKDTTNYLTNIYDCK